MENTIDMYFFPASPPVRAVLLLAHALGIVLNQKFVNILEGEQMKPDFLKLNPMHTVPTMDDGGYILWESKAIMKYLTDKFDKEGVYKVDSAEDEGRVNQLLYFDGTLFQRLSAYMMPVISGTAPPSQEQADRIGEGLQALNQLFTGRKYAAGAHMTLADFALAPTISTHDAIGINLNPYPNVMAWYKLVKNEMPGYQEINQKGSDMIRSAFNAKTG